MKPALPSKTLRRRHGFTLLESVAALVMVVFLAAILLPLYQSHSRAALSGLNQTATLEAMRAQFQQWDMQWNTLDIEDRTAKINAFSALVQNASLPPSISLESLATGTFSLTPQVPGTLATWVPGPPAPPPSGHSGPHLRIQLTGSTGTETVALVTYF